MKNRSLYMKVYYRRNRERILEKLRKKYRARVEAKYKDQ